SIESHAGPLQLFCCRTPVPVSGAEGGKHAVPFAQGADLGAGHIAAREMPWQVTRFDWSIAGINKQRFYDVAKLAYVARPVMTLKALASAVRQRSRGCTSFEAEF